MLPFILPDFQELRMHPVIRLIALVLLCFLVSGDNVPTLIMGLSLVAGFYVMTSLNYLYDAKQMLLKLRWFFVSITILFFWFTPGEALFGIHSGWMPTKEGVSLGLSRIFSLVLIVLAVNLFLQTTPRKELISALIWLMRPLGALGVPHQRFAVRMTLTLEAVTSVQNLFQEEVQGKRHKQQAVGGPMTKISARVANIYQRVIAKAESANCDLIEIPLPVAPPLYQWVYFPVAGLAFWFVNQI